MTKINESQLGLYFDRIMRRKFGEAHDWAAPEVFETIGPFKPEVFGDFKIFRDQLLGQCREYLRNFTDQEILILYDPKQNDPDRVRYQWDQLHLKEIKRLQPLPWYAAGFGVPEYQADFGYWGKMERYTFHEALMLSIGVEPSHITEVKINWLRSRGRVDKLHESLRFLIKRREIFARKFTRGVDGFISKRPELLRKWFADVELEIHPEFCAQLEKRSTPIQAKQHLPYETTISIQERQTLLKLIAAMSCEQYGFNPKKARNDATGSIRSDLEMVGLSLDDKTILKWLKEASLLVDGSYWDG